MAAATVTAAAPAANGPDAAMLAVAQQPRLPTDVVPRHYKLHLTPDLTAFTFTGTVAIDVEVGPVPCLPRPGAGSPLTPPVPAVWNWDGRGLRCATGCRSST